MLSDSNTKYKEALYSTDTIIEDLDWDRKFPLLGFGIGGQDGLVNVNAECAGIQGRPMACGSLTANEMNISRIQILYL